jgi:hypothetical protein
MDNQPQSAPEPEPEPAADAKASPRSESSDRAAGFAPRRVSGEAYTDRPEFTPRQGPRWPLALALALALGVAGIGIRRYAAAPAGTPVAEQTRNVLAFSQKDYDAATTESARALLARDKTTHELAALQAQRQAEPAPAAAPASAPVPAPAPTAAQQAAQELAAAPQALRDQVSAGKAGFYTFRLAELVDEGGDVYDISVDGAPLLRITTSPELTSLTIPMDVSRPHTVAQTLVFARPRGYYAPGAGNGAAPPVLPQNRASFAIQTSAGEARSHLSSAGESQAWNTQFLGSQ